MLHKIEEIEHKGEEHAGNDLWDRSGTGGPGTHDIKGSAPAPGGGRDRDPGERKRDMYRISDRSGGGSRDRGEGDHPCGVPDDEGRGGAEGEP